MRIARNMGTWDRTARLVVAAGALAAALVLGAGTVGGIVLLVVAGIMALTAASGYCPLYELLGVSTTGEGRTRHAHRHAHA
jgi:hypothetical protein